MPPPEEQVTWLCTVCDTEHNDDEFEPAGRLANGNVYCDDCEDRVVLCYHCDEAYEMGMGGYLDVDGGSPVCNDCYSSEGYFDCDSCSSTTHQENAYETEDGMVCGICREDHYGECEECSSVVSVSGTWYLDDSTMCLLCARSYAESLLTEVAECFSCGEGDCDDHGPMLEEVWPSLVAINAFSCAELQWTCRGCDSRRRYLPHGSMFSSAVMLTTGNFADAMCSECVRHGGRGPYRVRNYSHKPSPRFMRTERDLNERALHFGTEVEIDVANDRSRDQALERLGKEDVSHLFYCKHDVSAGAGFELVSHPFTYDWMRSNESSFQPMFGLADIMRGFESIKCGMHIHMSRDAFSELQMFKFMRFFHLNQKFIRALARRPKGRFDRWSKMVVPERSSLIRFAINKERIDFGRGVLNFGASENTIECRMFRSTLSPTAYFGNVEFLQGLFDYTKNCGADDSQLTEDRFIGYVQDRGRAYKNFVLLKETIRPHVEDNWEVECA